MKTTVGEQLRAARESKGITLDEAVKKTHIRRNYLLELENDRPELFLSDVQLHGFLRLYASFLGIPSLPLIEQWKNKFEREELEQPSTRTNEESPDKKSIDGSNAPLLSASEKNMPEEKAVGKKRFVFADLLTSFKKRFSIFSRTLPAEKEEKNATPEKMAEEAAVKEQETPLDSSRAVFRSSKEIFYDIGAALRERRLALELTLSDIERFTNIKRMYLTMMEEGHFEKLPSTVQGRGLLNNYSKFLALDETWIRDAYARALQ